MAEVFPGKQKYLADRFPGVPIFMDVCDMGRNNAPTVDGYSRWCLISADNFEVLITVLCTRCRWCTWWAPLADNISANGTSQNNIHFPIWCIPKGIALAQKVENACHSYLIPCQVDLLVAGFPCVSVSLLTTTPGSVLDKTCESGKGYRGMEDYVKKHRPSMLLLENVGSLVNKREVEGGDSG